MLLSPATGLNNYGLAYGLDNGAWSAYLAKVPFKEEPFRVAVGKIGANATFVVAPDIVDGGLASLQLTLSWLNWLLERVPVVLIAVQNGMVPSHVGHLLGPRTGIFVGGTSDWKEQTMAMWADVAHASGAICHVGRVNTARRVFLCAAAHVDSFDGSSVSRFAATLPLLDNARKQIDLFGQQARVSRRPHEDGRPSQTVLRSDTDTR